MNKNKIDVTSRVFGKMKGGSMSLYLEKDKIGQIHFTNQGNMYEMAEGFEVDQEKIYKSEKPAEIPNPSKYVDECDKGWC
ncbi:YusG family protein [Bacillus sp. NEB1478]|uniref:YusG family protein n=1 Tax=Bacillus sp. NEB1478 TaxID=3073816 RepID=UPI0028739B54|nr:YusG family protein [Bacillus sp. NEB1478]WNB92903.1 YusG family protein [Bacillus sp. NEB1478]